MTSKVIWEGDVVSGYTPSYYNFYFDREVPKPSYSRTRIVLNEYGYTVEIRRKDNIGNDSWQVVNRDISSLGFYKSFEINLYTSTILEYIRSKEK